MPIVTLDRVSLAFGTFRFRRIALQIEPRARVGHRAQRHRQVRRSFALSTGAGAIPERVAPAGMRSARSTRTRACRRPARLRRGGRRAGRPQRARHGLYHRAAVVAERAPVRPSRRSGAFTTSWREGRLARRATGRSVLTRLGLPPTPSSTTLSGAGAPGAARARAGRAADLLLLDEPTNHLDIEPSPGSRVPHRLSRRGAVRDARPRVPPAPRDADCRAGPGRLTSWPATTRPSRRRRRSGSRGGDAEEKFDKRLAEEEAWLRQGVKARRTRNEGRLRALLKMREERARGGRGRPVRLQLEQADPRDVCVRAERFSKAFGSRPVVREFSARIVRGDKIGVIVRTGGQDHAAAPAARGDRAGRRRVRRGRTSRWRTMTSSVSNWTRGHRVRHDR